MDNSSTLTVADDLVVSLAYTLTVEGEVIDNAQDFAPLEYLQGHHNILPALERQLTGLGCGQSKQVFLTAKDAYGEINPNAFAEMDKSQFPPNFDLQIGRELRVQDDAGYVHLASICEIKEDSVRLDLNHPLAGKDLLFDTTIVALRAATEDELTSGRVGGGCASCGSEGGCSGDCH